jgi:hypothetical protein
MMAAMTQSQSATAESDTLTYEQYLQEYSASVLSTELTGDNPDALADVLAQQTVRLFEDAIAASR